MKEVRQIPDLLDGDLARIEIGGKEALILTDDHDELMESQAAKDSVRLLPGFDPYMLGHADKAPLLQPEHYKRVYRNQGWISQVVLLNGEVAAIWSHTRCGKRLFIEIEPLRELPKRTRALIQEQAAGLAAFLETPADIVFTA
jgi:hypothetical protein